MFELYPDQKKMVDDTREALRKHRRVFVQAPTGSGKTVFAAHVIKLITENNYRSWFIAPRNKLVDQASETLAKFGVHHGRITANSQESRAFQVHVVSLNTLVRRLGETIREPDVLIFDESHVNINQIAAVQEMYPRALVICLSATPERGDGQGLDTIADTLVKGPQLGELVQNGRLSVPRYFFPDLGIDHSAVRWNGSEPNEKDISALFEKQKIYGRTIDMYKKHREYEPTILFERRVESAKRAARQFRDAGYNFQCVDGSMTKRALNAIFDGFTRGEINGLTSSDLLTYGVDLPTISCLFMLRLTRSVALYFQMIGRGLRLSEGKDSCYIFDQVNNIKEFGYPLLNREWDFYGNGSGGITEPAEKVIARQCPEETNLFAWCDRPSCAGCEHYTGKNKTQKPIPVVNCELKEYKHQEEFEVVKKQSKPAYQKDLDDTVSQCRKVITSDGIKRMVKYAKALGNDWRWIYDQINTGGNMANVGLLTAISDAYGYKPGWVWHKRKELRKRR